MALHKITELYTKYFSACPNITSKLRNIAILKNSVKENNDLNKSSWYDHDLSMYKTSFVYVRQFLSYCHKTKC
jgi:hypothetical protein